MADEQNPDSWAKVIHAVRDTILAAGVLFTAISTQCQGEKLNQVQSGQAVNAQKLDEAQAAAKDASERVEKLGSTLPKAVAGEVKNK